MKKILKRTILILLFSIQFVAVTNAKSNKGKKSKKVNSSKKRKNPRKVSSPKRTEKKDLDYKLVLNCGGGMGVPFSGAKEIGATKKVTFADKSGKKAEERGDAGAFDMLGFNIQGKFRGIVEMFTPYFYLGGEIGYSFHRNYLNTQGLKKKKLAKKPTGFMLHRMVLGLSMFSNVFGEKEGLRIGLIPKFAFNLFGSYDFMGKKNNISKNAISMIDFGLGLEVLYEIYGVSTGFLFDMYFFPFVKEKHTFLKHKYKGASKGKLAETRPGMLMAMGISIGYNLQAIWRKI